MIRLVESHPDWVLGFQDETWWSRLALPRCRAWTGAEPLRLVERNTDRTDPDPKALCCYGLLRQDTDQMLLRFVEGRPVSQVTEDYLAWVCEQLAAEGKKALLLVWDNASWTAASKWNPWSKRPLDPALAPKACFAAHGPATPPDRGCGRRHEAPNQTLKRIALPPSAHASSTAASSCRTFSGASVMAAAPGPSSRIPSKPSSSNRPRQRGPS